MTGFGKSTATTSRIVLRIWFDAGEDNRFLHGPTNAVSFPSTFPADAAGSKGNECLETLADMGDAEYWGQWYRCTSHEWSAHIPMVSPKEPLAVAWPGTAP